MSTTRTPAEEDLSPLELVDDAEAPASKKIHAFSAPGVRQTQQWKRQTTVNGTGAIRVKSFHGKLSDQGLDYLDEAINNWLDRNPEVEVKFVTSSTGVFEGKMREPALILNLWY